MTKLLVFNVFIIHFHLSYLCFIWIYLKSKIICNLLLFNIFSLYLCLPQIVD